MKKIITFVIFYILTCIVYINAFGAHFLDDTISWMYFFKHEGWSTFYTSFDFTSLFYGHDIIYNCAYIVFDTHALPWFLLLTVLHALNTFIGYLVFKKIFEKNKITYSNEIAICGAFLFLFSPYQTENIVWGATMHYGFSMLCMWTGFYLYENFLTTKKISYLIIFYLLFIFSIVTMEISLVFPGLYFIIFTFLWDRPFSRKVFVSNLKFIAFPMFLIIACYFLANNYVHGSYIGHYGSDTHTKTLFTLHTPGTMLQYFIKYTGYIHFFDYKYRDIFYSAALNPYILTGAFIFIIAAILFLYKKYKNKVIVSAMFFLLMITCLIPVSTMFFMYLNQVQNDRLGYFFSFFIYILICLLLSFTGKKILIGVVIIISVLNIYLLQNYIVRWKNAATVQDMATETFQWKDSDKVYVLNQPCYFEGAYIFRNDARMDRSLSILKDIEMYGRIQEIAWANMHSVQNSITIEQKNSNTLQVTLNEWGRWFWMKDKGGYDYADDFVKVDFDDWNHSYTVEFLQSVKENEVIIYYTPEGFKEFKLI
ncbi:MAG: hypothetical protein H7Y00_03905 [Fimbriimonadaceae bacterium]|nr:hypothetical protein [Chitinophagales bacterium]